jgi:hypothetical protein
MWLLQMAGCHEKRDTGRPEENTSHENRDTGQVETKINLKRAESRVVT